MSLSPAQWKRIDMALSLIASVVLSLLAIGLFAADAWQRWR